MKLHLSVIALSCFVSACAFFEEPIEDFGSVPALDSESASSEPPLPQTPVVDADEAQAPTRSVSAGTNDLVFSVLPLFDVPEDSQAISFVHLTDGNARRHSAVCKALLDQFEITPADALPANVENLIVWPVRGDNTSSDCATMLKEYEAVDISNKTAEKVSSSAKGPYILSKSTSADKRLIYDLSDVSNGGLETSLAGWQSMVQGDATSWPEYHSAK